MDIISYALAKSKMNDAVSSYLDEHLTNPTNPPIDDSLTIESAAADAKATGDAISSLNADITAKQDTLTFDSAPTENSTNPVTSGGVYTALQSASVPTELSEKVDAITTETIVGGKNLFDPSYLLTAGWTNTDGDYHGAISLIANAYTADNGGYPFVNEFAENTQYTFSMKCYTDNNAGGTSGGLGVYIYYTNGTFTYNSVSNLINTLTSYSWTSEANKTIDYILIKWTSKGANIWHFQEPQLEQGTTATSYEAYGQGSTVYQIDVDAIPDSSISAEKVTFDVPTIDATLSVSGDAADAKAVGDALANTLSANLADSFPSCFMTFAQTESDMTFVGDKLLTFGSSADDHSNYAGFRIYEVDFANKTATDTKLIKHNWGHVNSVDYSEGNDCFITSNAGQSTTDSGIIYIVENVTTLMALPANTELAYADYVKAIDCSAYDLGYKFQLCWGEPNNGRYDIAYLLTSDMANIYKIQLGKGSNEFSYGTLISGCADDEFNGTFRIISTYTNSNTEQNNGTAFKGGSIYACGTHSGKNIVKLTPQTDGTMRYERFHEKCYDETGTATTTYGEGIAFYKSLMVYGSGTVIGVYNM